MKIDKQFLPGARIYKTIIAVLLSLLLSHYVFHTSGFYMVIAVILAMKDNTEKTKKYAKDRILGTLLGGVIGYFILLLDKQLLISETSIIMMLINTAGILLLLWLSKLLKLGESQAATGCVVFLSIMLTRFNSPILPYVTVRVLETTMGVIIAMFINPIHYDQVHSENH